MIRKACDPPMKENANPYVANALSRALSIAWTAHDGQRDKAGAPYILHPLRVAKAMASPDERIVALLHDVVEDSTATLADLRAEGFSEAVVAAVDALTKREGESRLDAAKRAVQNPIARAVKLADVADNMDLSRIAEPTQADFDRMAEYAKVRDLLNAAGGAL